MIDWVTPEFNVIYIGWKITDIYECQQRRKKLIQIGLL